MDEQVGTPVSSEEGQDVEYIGWARKNWNTLYLTIASTICIVCQ